jgi:hypothetical protein
LLYCFFVIEHARDASVRVVSLKQDDMVAVSSAAGLVGSIAVQLARRAGAKVIGIASPLNHEWLTAHSVKPVAYGDSLANPARLPDGKAALDRRNFGVRAGAGNPGHHELEPDMRDLLLPWLAKTREDRRRLTLQDGIAPLIQNAKSQAVPLKEAELFGRQKHEQVLADFAIISWDRHRPGASRIINLEAPRPPAATRSGSPTS